MTGKELDSAREKLGLSPTEMAKAMGVEYDTYKNWPSNRRGISPAAVRCVELLLAVKGTRIGRRFGV